MDIEIERDRDIEIDIISYIYDKHHMLYIYTTYMYIVICTYSGSEYAKVNQIWMTGFFPICED